MIKNKNSEIKPQARRISVGDFRIDQSERQAIQEVISQGRISEWRQVKEFERLFAEYIGTKYCIAVSSGTAALLVGLLALTYDHRFPKAAKGKKIITSPITYISTVSSIVLGGFEPVFVDIDPSTFKLEVGQIEHLLKTSDPDDYAGLLPVHLMGYPNDMDELKALAEKHGLFVFEDCAQAHGTIYKGKRLGSLGLLADFSFYVAHNIQAGEMGCITTSDEALAKLIKQLKTNGRVCSCAVCTRNLGSCAGRDKYGQDPDEDFDPRFSHEYIAYNFKTTEFTAALGVSQVKKADRIFKKRLENVRYLGQRMRKFEEFFSLPPYDENISYLAYPITIKASSGIQRKTLRRELEDKGVENRPLFGCVPTQQPAFAYLRPQYKNRLPVAEFIGKNAFYVGCHQYLTKEDLDIIIDVFDAVLPKITSTQR